MGEHLRTRCGIRVIYQTAQIFRLEPAGAGHLAKGIFAPLWWRLSGAHVCLCHWVGFYARSRSALFLDDDIAPRGSNSLPLVENMPGNPGAFGASRFPSEVLRNGFHRDSLACL